MEPYRVSYSGLVDDQIESILVRSEREGLEAIAGHALECLMAELKSNPNELGESRYELPNAKLKMRLAFVRPFAVSFAIHEDSKTVFIARVGWSKPS